ncbi:MAG TPA: M66 family metalloprotease [Polyangiaceae bacterium]|nr:M66 family metalloprotease [Polyangiaceae bacterium]
MQRTESPEVAKLCSSRKRPFVGISSVFALGVIVGCSAGTVDDPSGGASAKGGGNANGGANENNTGPTGGSDAHGGTSSASGGAPNGSGGARQSGGSSSGGSAGGSQATGGTQNGTSTGGRSAGGSSSGGQGAGGRMTGTGGTSSGGSSSRGGAPNGGSGNVAGSSPSGDDGCGSAANVTLSQIAVYQTVKIPIMQSGTEVAVASRKTDVVAGKDAMFRLFVTPDTGFTAHAMSGRIVVDNGGTIDTYYSKVNISGASAEGSLTNTFQVTVPKDKITRTTQYYAEIAECGTMTGTGQSARFPASGSTAVGARETGTLKIKVIPLSANSMVADTSATALNVYKAAFMAMYPITSIDITVGDTLTVSDPKDWTSMLDAVRSKRQMDQPPADVYYYGFLKPTNTLQQYCGNGCTAGIGYVVPSGSSGQVASQRAALGLAYADTTSAQTMVHEVGHNHGRNHAPCVQGGTINGVDANYPYSNGATGVYGWDNRNSTLLDPNRTDIMGYCNNKWISDYTYDGILTRVATVNGAPMSVLVPAELIHPWRVLLVDSRGSRWGAPIDQAVAPAGQAELADVLDATGNHITTTTVYRTEIADLDAFSFEVPPPEAGWAAIQVKGGPALSYP